MKFRNVLRWGKRNLIRLKMMSYAVVHPQQKKIVFNSFNGKQYSDNPRAISEEMHLLYPEYEIVWHLLNDEDPYDIIPDYIRVVKEENDYQKEVLTAFCFVTNTEMKTLFYKRNKQLYIQTWHGDQRFKKILYEIGDEDFRCFDDKLIDLCISSSEFGNESYRNALRYSGNILCKGSPRSELMLKMTSDRKNELKHQLGIGSKKVLLYAPTFRDNLIDKQSTDFDFNMILANLQHYYSRSDEWVCLLRAHPSSVGISSFTDSVIDVSKYPDMTDILSITDFLITDYSSSVGDFALTGLPIILYVSDIDEYENKYRAFKVNPLNVGLKIARSQNQVIEVIKKTTPDEFRECDKSFLKRFQVNETCEETREICELINRFYIENYS